MHHNENVSLREDRRHRATDCNRDLGRMWAGVKIRAGPLLMPSSETGPWLLFWCLNRRNPACGKRGRIGWFSFLGVAVTQCCGTLKNIYQRSRFCVPGYSSLEVTGPVWNLWRCLMDRYVSRRGCRAQRSKCPCSMPEALHSCPTTVPKLSEYCFSSGNFATLTASRCCLNCAPRSRALIDHGVVPSWSWLK
jgi:hypothetical protein